MLPPSPSGATTEVVAAVDVGGTRIKAALVDRSYTVLAQTTTPTPADIGADIGGAVAATVKALLESVPPGQAAQLVGCGVVVPGLVDEEDGIGIYSSNLGWRDLDIRAQVESFLGLPAVVGHDVRAGLLAESRLGAAGGHRQVLFMPLGTGIAGALLLDGSVVSGDGWAGELGHVVIDPSGPPCPCGQRGCLEVLASAGAIERIYRSQSHERLSAEDIAARAEAGESLASSVWAGAVRALGQAIVMTVTLTGVDLVLVGGGLSQSGEVLLRPLRDDVAGRLTFQRPPTIQRAGLGDRAGSLGAACLIWDSL
ncbi:ROK family protein [Pedococcus bigeumensis]|uniref:ROK family protein n=2 Tax=Pedococcus bigeumensis TaxID=433644 RepID=A0A502CNI4_9MICO|nr:ROK family protein [Pedococcus bigeumensis]